MFTFLSLFKPNQPLINVCKRSHRQAKRFIYLRSAKFTTGLTELCRLKRNLYITNLEKKLYAGSAKKPLNTFCVTVKALADSGY